jgi:hypothetical protein
MRSPDEITPAELAEATRPEGPLAVSAPVDEGYPRALAKRPYLLPDGMSSISLGMDLAHLAQPDVSAVIAGLYVDGVLALGTTELSADLALTPFTSQDAPEDQQLVFPTVRALSASIRQRVGNETALAAGLAITFPGSDYQGFSPSLSLGHKVHVSDRAAVIVGGGFEVIRAVTTREFGGFVDYTVGGGYGSLLVQANVTEDVCVVANTIAEQFVYLDDVMPGSDYRQYLTRLGLVVAAGDSVDVSFGLSIFSSGGRDSKAFSFTLTARRMP